MAWSPTFRNRAEVLSWLASTTKGQEAVTEAEAAGPTFGDLADEWLDGVHSGAVARRRGRKGSGYSRTTLEGYERSLRYVLTPEFGARAASEIDDREWQTWVDRLSREGLSRSRIANHLAVARAIYGWASRPTRRLVDRNPLGGIELPPTDEKPRTRVADAEEAATLIAALDPADAVPYALAFYAGLRRAEIKRLDWPDVELDGYRLVVQKAKSPAGTGRRPPIAEPLRPVLLGEFMRHTLRELMEYMGHSSLQATERYVKRFRRSMNRIRRNDSTRICVGERSEMTDANNMSIGDEPPAQALLGYMKWFSEERWCAGWLIQLHTEMARLNDPAFKWLVEQTGGWWWWPDGADDVVFQPGSLIELRGG